MFVEKYTLALDPVLKTLAHNSQEVDHKQSRTEGWQNENSLQKVNVET